MNLLTFTVVAGGTACNAECHCCVARMTGSGGVSKEAPELNWWQWMNFDSACRIASKSPNIVSAMITSKGEATIYHEQLTEFVKKLEPHHFPFVELQTNGLLLANKPEIYEPCLLEWRKLGMNLIALSVVHYDREKNREFYTPKRDYMDLPGLIKRLHDPERKYSVRLSLLLARDYIDSGKEVENLLKFAKENEVEQVALKVITKPEQCLDRKVYQWVAEHQLNRGQLDEIGNYVKQNGRDCSTLPHGALICNINGISCSLTGYEVDCFKKPKEADSLRQLIFFPDGSLMDGWDANARRLL